MKKKMKINEPYYLPEKIEPLYVAIFGDGYAYPSVTIMTPENFTTDVGYSNTDIGFIKDLEVNQTYFVDTMEQQIIVRIR